MKKFVISITFFLAVLPAFAGMTGRRGVEMIDVTTGRNASAPAEVTISPNPVHGQWFTVEISSGYIKDIRILNITGTEVYHRMQDAAVSRYRIYTGKLPDGVYLLKITTHEQHSRTYKLMICNSGRL